LPSWKRDGHVRNQKAEKIGLHQGELEMFFSYVQAQVLKIHQLVTKTKRPGRVQSGGGSGC